MKQGEVEKLGVHILMCGDATNPEDVENLFMHATFPCETPNPIRLILTDPPYGVNYVKNKRDFFKKGGSKINVPKDIEADDLTGGDYREFTKKWMAPIKDHLDRKNAFYIFNGDTNLMELMEAIQDEGFKRSQLIIWLKNTIVKGRWDYNPQHELIVYGWYGVHKFEKMQSKSVLFYPKPAKSKIHPTMKPVGIIRKLILNSTKIGETVYDPFGGSGTTLIACEHTKRRCLMIEKDPEYCKAIIQRFNKLTEK